MKEFEFERKNPLYFLLSKCSKY